MKISISQHALQQMFRRNISVEDVKGAVKNGEMIKSYPDDNPYPSKLVLFTHDNKPLHVVFAENIIEKEIIVITAYEPDSKIWSPDFKSKIE
jgi:hypothetical protein